MLNSEYIWEKDEEGGSIWWKHYFNRIGTLIISFDRKKEYNLFTDYPWKLTAKEKEIFDKENPYWADFFRSRK